ncbi:hypothetical protein OHA21_04310 [Actinoplanes sp. NBC_00393]|uniref:hypothetical protein n=1 Tax=Actinoplanes sp. NBC_00393 TaxID=2975953 RepID=UPI002E1AE453
MRSAPADALHGPTSRLKSLVAGSDAAEAAYARLTQRLRRLERDETTEAAIAATSAVLDLGRAVSDPAFLVRRTSGELSAIETQFNQLARRLDGPMDDLDLRLRRSELPPLWLDVVAPAHDRLVVWESSAPCEPQRLTTADTPVVVQANNCRLDAREHYRIRRVSLDCEDLYRDPAVLEAFLTMMLDPSEANHEAFKARVSPGLPDRAPEGERRCGRQLPPSVAMLADGADVVAQGDNSRLRTETCYHVEEAAIPLAELLVDNRDLAVAMAARFGAGPADRSAGDPLGIIRGMVDGIADEDLLTYTDELGRGASVSRSLFEQRVNLAGAVMVGYGNQLNQSTRIGLAWGAGWMLKEMIGKKLKELAKTVELTQPPQPQHQLSPLSAVEPPQPAPSPVRPVMPSEQRPASSIPRSTTPPIPRRDVEAPGLDLW